MGFGHFAAAGEFLIAFAVFLPESFVHSRLHGIDGHLPILHGNVLDRNADAGVVIGNDGVQLGGRVGGQVLQHRLALTDVSPTVLVLEVEGLAVGQRDLFGAVRAVLDPCAKALHEGHHLVDVGDGDAADGHKLLAVRLEDRTPGLRLVDSIEAFALCEQGNRALEHLAEFGPIGERAEEIDVADQAVVAGDSDHGDRLHVDGCGGGLSSVRCVLRE